MNISMYGLSSYQITKFSFLKDRYWYIFHYDNNKKGTILDRLKSLRLKRRMEMKIPSRKFPL